MGALRRLSLVTTCFLLLLSLAESTGWQTPSSLPAEAVGKSSLTFVFDITGSMFDDLVQVREGASKIFRTVMQQREKLIYNYILVPFHDPDLGEIINTTDSSYFMRQLSKVYVHGGGDCPEKTLTGIHKALEISLPSSFVYVFTDARSKDYNLEEDVLNLIQEKQSSVVFVMTGDCGNRTHPGFRTYEKIAAASFGQVFHLEKSDVSTVLEYVRHAVKQKKVHLLYEAREEGGFIYRDIPVDDQLSELTLSLQDLVPWLIKNTYLVINMTGLIPPGTVNKISLLDYTGNELLTQPASPIRENPHMYFIGPFVPPKGLFFVRVSGTDDQDYEYMRVAPTAIGSVTVGGPRVYVPEIQTVFVGKSVNLSCMVESAVPFTVNWTKNGKLVGGPLFYDTTDTATWVLTEIALSDSGDYICEVTSDNGNATAKMQLETREAPPQITGVRNETAALMGSAFLHCPTISSSKAEIRWLRHGVSVLNGPNTKIYENGTLRIFSTSRSDAGMYECQARSAGGMTSQSMILKIMEPPVASISPKLLYFVPSTSINFSCYVQGDPPPEPHWFVNGRRISPDSKYYISYKNDLIIRVADPYDVGQYECRAVSPAGMHAESARAELAKPPEVQLTQSKTMIGRGDSISFECKVTAGLPAPSIRWLRNGKELLQSSRGYINIENGHLQITITLQCLAIGQPAPQITWYKDSVELDSLNNPRYTVLADGNLLITNAQMEDQSRYTCIAKNPYGQQSQNTNLIITGLTSPVLGHVPPEEQLVEGEDLRLSCVVVLGTPKPQLLWFKDGKPIEPSPTVIVEGGGTSLLLRDGNPKDEGKYTCAAISPAGNTTLNINVNLIKKPEFVIYDPGQQPTPSIAGVSQVAQPGVEHSVIEGDGFAIPCPVSGAPPPTVTWSLDGRPIATNNNEFSITTDNTLIVHKTDKSLAGTYTCTAVNAAGEIQQSTPIKIMTLPIISPGQSSFNLIQGTPLSIPCNVQGEPKATIKWYLNDVEFTNGTVDEDGTLLIEDVHENLKGSLKCVATNEAGSDERVVSLTVHTAPIIDGSGTTVSRVALANDTVVLACPARAEPPPVRIWSYEGSRIDTVPIPHKVTKDGELVLSNIDIEHAGYFTCLVSNLAGDDSITYELEVQEKPRIISETPGTLDVVKGLTLEIPCTATGTPQPERSWEKDGILLSTGNSSRYGIDSAGTLRIFNTAKEDGGQYKCLVENGAGSESQTTSVVVQEPPVFSPHTIVNYTAVAGDVVELRCAVEAYPPATIQWTRKGVPVTESTPGMKVENDGTLVIAEASKEDDTFYSCKATNPAGIAEKNMRLSIIVAPEMPDQDIVAHESVKVSQPFSLYCPVLSTPLPTISWQLNDKPMAEVDANVQFSDDKRKLHVEKARVTDAGVYKCVARNSAGEGSKSFEVEVLVPLNIDESEWKKKVVAKEGEYVEIGCPVSGLPSPTINWIVGGTILRKDEPYRGIKLADSGKTLIIEEASLDNMGMLHCVAQNKAGTLDVDVELVVLAAPNLGADENIEIVKGKEATLSCDNNGETDEKHTVSWLVNNSESLPSNVQVPLNGHRLFIVNATAANAGSYSCKATNSAGEDTKIVNVAVLEPPEFLEKEYNESIRLIRGQPLNLACLVSGNPRPNIEWRMDKETIIGPAISDDGQKFDIDKLNGSSAHVVCLVSNKAGSIARDFFVQSIAPPKFTDSGDRIEVQVSYGDTITLDCPVSGGGDVVIEWLRQGSPITDKEAIFSVNKSSLIIMNAEEEHEDVYTCTAKNSAGEATKEFNVSVLVAPYVRGTLIENIEIIENNELQLDCVAEGNPDPKVTWKKDGGNVPQEAEVLNENMTLVIRDIRKSQAGVYRCFVKNVAGTASKTFNVHVLEKPVFVSKTESEHKVDVERAVTLECDVKDPTGVEISWTRHQLPIVSGVDDVQLLSGGRYLHVASVQPEDEGSYEFPPEIINDGGEYTVIENNSLVLPCEVEGNPPPVVTWTKDGRPISSLEHAQVLSEGQQFKIVHAQPGVHRGSYLCQAKNDVGSTEISFDVDVITRPSLAKGIKEVVEVIQGETAHFKCPIVDKNFKGDVTWLRNFNPIDYRDGRLTKSQNDRRLHLSNSSLQDEGLYSCRIKNDAGENKFDYKLQVLIPPTILILDKDKNRTVIEKTTVTLSCPVTGKPEPDIVWLKEGEMLFPDNISDLIDSASIVGNELKISRVKESDSGRYSCEATNKAGSTDQDIFLNVMTPPRIEKEGIPAEYDQMLDNTVTISCPVFGKPTPSVTWLKAGKSLESNANVKTSANGQKLYLLKLQKDDADKYTCIAKNPAGEEKRDFSVRILEAPTFEDPNLVRKVQTIAGKTSIFNCPASGSPQPTITWIRDGETLSATGRHVFLDGGRQLQISNTETSDKGRYTCIATNSVGSDDLETTLDVIAPPVIEGQPTEVVEVFENSRHDLLCEVNDTGSRLEIEWQKSGQTISQETLKDENLIQIPSSGRKLNILSARTSDAGRYTCVVKNSAGEARKSFDVKILGQRIRDEDGQPSENKETLVIDSITPENIGKYTCEAMNKAGLVRKDFILRLSGPPVLDGGPENLAMKVGDSMTLTCKVSSGSGNVTVSWLINDVEAQNGVFSPTVEVLDRQVKVSNARLSDAANYICIAKNEAGEVRKPFHLMVWEKPRFMDTNTRYPIVLDKSVIFDCSVTGTPKPTVVWFKVRFLSQV
ncbi:unnamed protein product [Caenorhabditis auriculariae]|uniref:Ig-like domain-containing protein n=1 Tax=Caenorhabditis auriculariae TaxID=2777116 RepID=A0A8S1H251_9PELO|nr:unnamed protein product [Caenorhabditis auriculariae]